MNSNEQFMKSREHSLPARGIRTPPESRIRMMTCTFTHLNHPEVVRSDPDSDEVVRSDPKWPIRGSIRIISDHVRFGLVRTTSGEGLVFFAPRAPRFPLASELDSRRSRRLRCFKMPLHSQPLSPFHELPPGPGPRRRCRIPSPTRRRARFDQQPTREPPVLSGTASSLSRYAVDIRAAGHA